MEKARSIIIVEDEVLVSMSLSMELRNAGFIIYGCAATGKKAIELVDENPPDIILMDIHLSGELNGLETAADIRSRHSLPIIFMTGYSDKIFINSLSSAEKTDYIVKPAITADLILKINKMLL